MKTKGILLSGGIDSNTLLLKYKKSIKKAFFIDYGSDLNKKELDIVQRNTKRLGISLEIIDLTSIFPKQGSSIFGDKELIDIENAIIPFRNLVMVSSILPTCVLYNITEILIGTHDSDAQTFPDCTKGFNNTLNAVLQNADNYTIKVIAPYEDTSKEGILKEASRLGLNITIDTWSCYMGGDKPCGKCPNCKLRKGD